MPSSFRGFPPAAWAITSRGRWPTKLRGTYAANMLVEQQGRRRRPHRRRVRQARRARWHDHPADPDSVMVLYPHIYKNARLRPVHRLRAGDDHRAPMPSRSPPSPALPAEIKTVAEYVKWAKANPKHSAYGIPAAGSALHFAGMMLQRAADMEMTGRAVSGRRAAAERRDGRPGAGELQRGGRGAAAHSRAASCARSASTSAQRSPFLPDVPTLREQGYKDIAVQEWLGWFLPAKTPAEIVNTLNALGARRRCSRPTHGREPGEVRRWSRATSRPRSSPCCVKARLRPLGADRARRPASPRRTRVTCMRLTGAQALVRILPAEQVPFAFGIVGGKLAPLLHAIARAATHPLHRRAARGRGADDGGGGATPAGPHRGGARRDGPGGLNLASGTGRRVHQQLAAAG